MSEERLDYAILISLAMREEAEVMASALRAEGVDAFVSAISYNWHMTLAFGGVQVFVPWAKVDEAKQVIRERIKEAAAHPEGEAVGRRDRWKLWTVLACSYGFPLVTGVVGTWLSAGDPDYAPAATPMVEEFPTYFAASDALTEAEQRVVLHNYCLRNPTHAVISREDGMGYITPCSDVLRHR
ncbi:MAG: hypothetical protein ABMA14_03950 [Hyphomonadaceae bacterium]